MKTYIISFDGLTFTAELTPEEVKAIATDQDITIKEVKA